MKIVPFQSARSPRRLCQRPLVLLMGVILSASCVSAAAEVASAGGGPPQVEFDSAFLIGNAGSNADISRFERGDSAPPGDYRVDLYVNDQRIGRTDVSFRSAGAAGRVQACITSDLLRRTGADLSQVSAEVPETMAADSDCVGIDAVVDGALDVFDFAAQRLDLSVPQVALLRTPRGYVNPDSWDAGVSTGFVNYALDGYTADNGSGRSSQAYLGLDMGINMGSWRLRHDASARIGDTGERQYQAIATYAKRDVAALGAQLTIGEDYTSGELFDSTGFRGIRLESDDRMLPESLRGYAPVVSGVAYTNARVTIRQNGIIVHESTVAPGEFQIDDLYATGYGGDLEVTVQEADGSTQQFSVPFASVPQSLRAGVSRYSVVAGTARSTVLKGDPAFAQATWQRGISSLATGYVGTTLAQDYRSAMAGVALNTPLGAIGADVTHASTRLPGRGSHSGASYRLSYARLLPATGTNITLAGHRYSTSGFLALNEALAARELPADGDFDSIQRQRNRAALTVGQKLGARGGRLNATASLAHYWNRSGSDLSYTLGYSASYRGVGYSLSARRQQSGFDRPATHYSANATFSLGKVRPLTATANVAQLQDGRSQFQSTLIGAIGADGALSYGVSARTAWGGDQSAERSGSVNLGYRGRVAVLSGSASVGAQSTQASLSARGAIIAHGGGITFSQPVSETFGLVHVPDARGAKVLNAAGVKVDRRGYAAIPYLSPYRINRIEIDPKGLSTDVELKATSQHVVPHAGLAPLLKFDTTFGRSALLQLTMPGSGNLPFGAAVVDDSGAEVGVVGQAGRVFARGLQESGTLSVIQGEDGNPICRVDYSLPQRPQGSALAQVAATCVGSPAQ